MPSETFSGHYKSELCMCPYRGDFRKLWRLSRLSSGNTKGVLRHEPSLLTLIHPILQGSGGVFQKDLITSPSSFC